MRERIFLSFYSLIITLIIHIDSAVSRLLRPLSSHTRSGREGRKTKRAAGQKFSDYCHNPTSFRPAAHPYDTKNPEISEHQGPAITKQSGALNDASLHAGPTLSRSPRLSAATGEVRAGADVKPTPALTTAPGKDPLLSTKAIPVSRSPKLENEKARGNPSHWYGEVCYYCSYQGEQCLEARENGDCERDGGAE